MSRARSQFQRVRRQAALREALASLTGEKTRLMAYDEVRSQLRYTGSAAQGARDIPIRAIVGSVGRYQDFTRSFLPINPKDEERWVSLRTYLEEGHPIPAIDVYQMGDAYFVIDGNHRISIARQLGIEYIPARVTEVKTRVPFSKNDSPEFVLCKSRYADFLTQTNLDSLRPGSNLLMTFCDQYDLLLSQIEVQRYFLWRDTQVEHAYPDVVAYWYDHWYLPVVELIRAHNLPDLFPERTEADLYILMTEHRLELARELGMQVEDPQVAAHLAENPVAHSPLRRLVEWIRSWFVKSP